MSKMKLVSSAMLAERLGCTPDYIRRLCRDGKLKATKVGHDWILNEQDIKNFKLSENKKSKTKA